MGDEERNAPKFLWGGGGMGERMRAYDWSGTPLGEPAVWPQSLRSATSIMLNSRYPIALYWGDDLALLYNDAWSAILGTKHPWALGRPGREVWPEIWDTIGPLYDKVRSTGEGVWQEDELLPMLRHGYVEECYFNFTFSPVRGEDGGIDGIFNAVIETTDRVLSERRLRTLSRLGERASATLSANQASQWASDILADNPADAPVVLVYLKEGDRARLVATVGSEPGSVAAPEQVGFQAADQGVWPFAQAEQTDGPVAASPQGLGLVSRYGSEPLVEAVVVPIRLATETGAAGFLVAGANPRRRLDPNYLSFFELAASHLGTALTTARAYEDERARAEALLELDRAKTAFFSNVSHEFRTPLTLMLGPLEEVLAKPEGEAPSPDRELVRVAHRNGLRLLRLVNALLDFSRIEAGRVEARFAPADLAALTADLASTFRSLCERAGLSLRIECEPLPEPVYLDRDMWEKVVLNLLSNAFKFTLAGEITVRLKADGRMARLEVGDTGVGVPQSEIPRLFERFHRVAGAKGRSFEGSGIGLALVHDLVALHGGAIRAESTVGKGTTFIVELPFGRAHLPAAQVAELAADSSGPAHGFGFVEEAQRWLPGEAPAPEFLTDTPATSDAETSGVAGRVLLADDNADLRDYVGRLLRARGYEVTVAADGAAALASARAERPDLILTDVMMPELDGFGLLAAVRSDPALADVPVIMLSARAGEEAQVEGLDSGADDYLSKPFSTRELLARVSANLALARVRREAAQALQTLNAELERRVEQALGERETALNQLHESQKLETIGQLTGGVAHDFNNLLTPIVGALDLLRRRQAMDDRTLRLVDAAQQAAERARVLISRLLTFARRQYLEPRPIDVVELAFGMRDLVERTLGPTVTVSVDAQPVGAVMADGNQLELAILNLCVNARDAMPGGGKVEIIIHEAEFTGRADLPDGRYVCLAVRDAGIGMDAATLQRAVEPFFTTKGVGRGTGLGLSMAHGLAAQSGGALSIESHVGVGTTVSICLPVVTDSAIEPHAAPHLVPAEAAR